MTREEQLKQAIDANIKAYMEEQGWDKAVVESAACGAEYALSTPSILRHADPLVMEQAGWVKEIEVINILSGLVTDVGNLLSEHDGIEWQQAGYYNAAKELLGKIKQAPPKP